MTIVSVLFGFCVAMIILSLFMSASAIGKILETTPAMGIPVDANGIRIPVQGYSELGYGLTSVVVFSALTTIFGLIAKRIRSRNKLKLS